MVQKKVGARVKRRGWRRGKANSRLWGGALEVHEELRGKKNSAQTKAMSGKKVMVLENTDTCNMEVAEQKRTPSSDRG